MSRTFTRKLSSILLVDDDESTNLLHLRAIKKLDCAEHVKVVENGEHALAYLESCARRLPLVAPSIPELIFLDINMPKMNGWEFLQQYQDLDAQKKANAVIVMLTTSLQAEDLERARGFDDITAYENKLLTPEKLEKILRTHFSYLFSSESTPISSAP